VFTRKVAVVVARPRDEVFAFVADARNRPRWDDSVDSEELTSPEPIAVGSTLRTKLQSMGRDYVYDWEIVEHDPPDRVRIESTSGPFPTTLEWKVHEHDAGSLVEFTLTGRPSGGLRLLQPLIARNTRNNLNRSFPRLKKVLEAR
jgi:carbon monoxide dehydrogenase subunit G